MENMFSLETWPWIALLMAAVGFVVGMLFGKPRMLSGWGGGGTTCEEPCNCRGANCPHVDPPHVHCYRRDEELSCSGTCTLAKGHGGAHSCSHRGHAF